MITPTRDLLDRLCAPPDDPRPPPATAIVVAHPDDESLGAGARFLRLRETVIVHVTDGAPRNLRYARAAGFSTRTAYARARRQELEEAMQLAGVPPDRTFFLGYADQEAAFHLSELTRQIAALLRATAPELVLTHPYEGGHPDHDAVAFAVHAAVHGCAAPALAEMTFYHDRVGQMAVGEFLPRPDGRDHEPVTRILTDPERQFKRRLLACFRTQQRMLDQFPIERESFRPAPAYDFTRPPHPGVLFYERFDWGMTGERFRELARRALEGLK